MEQGWIKLHRTIRDCWVWNDKEPFDKRSAWVDLLMMANHEEAKILFNGSLMTIKKGQFITSILELSKKWKWDRKKTTRFINLLEKDKMVATKRTTDGTVITIVKWEIFQDNGTTIRTILDTTDGTTMGQQVDNEWDTNKNEKNDKNDKNDKKNIYGAFQNVRLTEDEYAKIKEQGMLDLLEELSSYIEQVGVAAANKKYKSHYAVILNWHRKRKSENAIRKGKTLNGNPSFDIEELKRKAEMNENFEF